MKNLLLISSLFLSTTAFSLTNNALPNNLLLWLAILILTAGLGMAIQHFGQPSVLGDLVIGMSIAILGHHQVWQFALMQNTPIINFLAELGSIFLMFEIGLSSDIKELKQVGRDGLMVAVLGIAFPFLFGYFIIVPYIIGTLDPNLRIFLGATIAATSTGITISVFKELNLLKSKVCQIVLTASVIDDVIGLTLLAVVTGILSTGNISVRHILLILLKVIIFFSIAITLGRTVIPLVSRKILIRINNEEPMLMLTVIAFCLLLAWFSQLIGLAPIIGGFLAGLLLDEVTFREYKKPSWYRKLYKITRELENKQQTQFVKNEILGQHAIHRLEEVIKPFSNLLVPIFFIHAGMQVDIIKAFNFTTLKLGLIISVLSIVGKLLSSIFLPKHINKWIVGFGMVPRGEIGLIFAITGREAGIIDDDLFAAILIMIVITSLITPIALAKLVKPNSLN